MTSLLRAALLALPILVAGCAGIAPVAPAPAETGAIRAYWQTIAIAGRMSVRYQQNGREEALHGSFDWRQRPGHTELTLSSPLGQTLAKIEIGRTGSTLTQAGQPALAAADADALAAQALGWPLPVSGLRDWLQGHVAARGGKRIVATPQDEGTDIVTADGWRIRYAAWDNTSAPRPRRIDLTRTTKEAGEVALRLVIDTFEPR